MGAHDDHDKAEVQPHSVRLDASLVGSALRPVSDPPITAVGASTSPPVIQVPFCPLTSPYVALMTASVLPSVSVRDFAQAPAFHQTSLASARPRQLPPNKLCLVLVRQWVARPDLLRIKLQFRL